MAKKAIKARGKKAAAKPMRKLVQQHLKKTGGTMGSSPMQPYKMDVIKSVRDLIKAMGGPKAAEEALDGRVNRDAVSQWGYSGKVPYVHQYKVDRWARRNGFLIDPRLFGEKQLFPEEKKLLKAA